jgi:hypothetical protein
MGKNTPERQDFIIENLKVVKDYVHEEDTEESGADEMDDDLESEFEQALISELNKR